MTVATLSVPVCAGLYFCGEIMSDVNSRDIEIKCIPVQCV